MPRLEAGRAAVALAPEQGGRIASFTIDGVELLVTDGPRAFDWGLYPMVPFAGRIPNGRFSFNGREHRVHRNLPPHAIHGTLLDRAWTLEDEHTMVAELTSPWPFRGRVRHVVDLQPDALHCRLEVDAAEPMPVTVGWHPWWRRPVDLQFTAEAMYERDGRGITTDRLGPPPPGPWDDCFTALAGPPVLRWPNGIEIVCESSCAHWVVYTEPAHAICVEPQTGPPNAVNLGLAEIAAPGRPVIAEATWRFRVLQG